MSEPVAIHTDRLRKTFGPVVAVKDVSLTVAWGENFALLGTNGAGKSTLMRLLTTLVPPTSGKALVAGYDVETAATEVRKSIGVVPQGVTTDPELTAFEALEFHARLYRIRAQTRRRLIPQLLESVNLEHVRDRLVGTFSGGMRRRLEIARGLLHGPRILFLDEPTTGLDPVSRAQMWDMIRRLKEQTGLTIILTTHYMDEADQLCDRIAIVDRGTVVAQGTPAHLKAKLRGTDRVEVLFAEDPEPWRDALVALPAAEAVRITERLCAIETTDRLTTLDALLALVRGRGIAIEALDMRGSTLDDVFIHWTEGRVQDAHGGTAKS